MYYVAGGEFISTEFKYLNMSTLEVHGPFSDQRVAVDVWRGASQRSVDNCQHRMLICQPLNGPNGEYLEVGDMVIYLNENEIHNGKRTEEEA